MQEFSVKPYSVPDAIDFNYEELKQELVKRTEMYKTMVYTEDQIKEAKADRANLNKAKKALNDERIRVQKIYMKPFDDFKMKVDDLIKTIDGAASVIDKQVKAYEDQEKKKKEARIQELFKTLGFQPCVTIEKIWDPRWLNKSVSMKQIEQEMNDRKYKVSTDLLTLESMPDKEIAVNYYKTSLDLNDAIHKTQEHVRFEKMKAEAAELAAMKEKAREEREAAEQANGDCAGANQPEQELEMADQEKKEPVRQWISFRAYLSMEEAGKLKMFFDSLGIDFKPL